MAASSSPSRVSSDFERASSVQGYLGDVTDVLPRVCLQGLMTCQRGAGMLGPNALLV